MRYRTLLFSYTEITFMLPAELCREVFTLRSVLPLPAAHSVLLGLTEVRGRAVPLLDLAALHALHSSRERTTPPAGADPPALALLVDFQGELLALPVEQMLGVSAVDTLPPAQGMVFESTPAQNRDIQYIHHAALLSTIHSRLLQA